MVPSTVVSDIMATPKKLLRAWEGRSGEAAKLDEELMSTRIREVEALTELKELRLKVWYKALQIQYLSQSVLGFYSLHRFYKLKCLTWDTKNEAWSVVKIAIL